MTGTFQQLPLSIGLDVDATLDNFYVMAANQTTLAAFQHFLQQPVEALFYLWGGQASGVSHLLQSVDRYLPAVATAYLPLKTLYTAPMINIDALDSCALLCLDDIEVVAGHPVWEETLFHVFNRMRDKGGRILVGSHMPPRQLPLQLADLKSRLQWGGAFYLHELDDEAKQSAMQSRASQLGFVLPDEVARYILLRAGRSLAELYGMLDVLDRASLAEHKKLTIPFVKKILAL